MFSNKQSDLDAARRYRDDAIADGWRAEPLYAPNEELERAAKLKRDGFVMHVISRDNTDGGYRMRFEVAVNVWGPDGLVVKPPRPYQGMKAIVEASQRCSHCGNQGGTERYSFAGRCCKDCLPEMRKLHEQPGWNF